MFVYSSVKNCRPHSLACTCPYGHGGKSPKNVSKIEEESTQFYFHLHRTGQLCGGCEENYTLRLRFQPIPIT